jgi:O-phospho-L-seryl-tRNASec:L-selenocysteinyl-tRNA synthase
MDEKTVKLAKGLVEGNMIDAAAEAARTNASMVQCLLAQRRMPEEPWPRPVIQHFLYQLSCMDSNNFVGHAGGGEREGRVYSTLVADRHFGMTHGIGRSGDLTADQPKAAGSSLLSKLTNSMALDSLRVVGLTKTQAAIAVPLATGMSLALVLQAARQQRPRPSVAKYVIWPRIDQKTSLKCITAAGLVAVPVALRAAVVSDSPRGATVQVAAPDEAAAAAAATTAPAVEVPMWTVHVDDVHSTIAGIAASDPDGLDSIVCVLSTTSCFAPRVPDDTLVIARMCLVHGIPLVVNNAYGLQSAPIAKRLDAALALGDVVCAFVQSMDKNYLTPVGGSVVGGSKSFVSKVAELYPGRASAAPTIDLFITLLEMGRSGWRRLHNERVALAYEFHRRMRAFAAERDEVLSIHPRNDISLCMTLRNLELKEGETAARLGANLFRHRVTGPKVIFSGPDAAKKVCGRTFQGYGTHSDAADVPPQLVVACGVGMTGIELDVLLSRLAQAYPVPKPKS